MKKQKQLLNISEYSDYLRKNVEYQCDFKRRLISIYNFYYAQCVDVDLEFKYLVKFDKFMGFLNRTFFRDEFKKPLVKYQKDFEKTFGVTYKKYEKCFLLNPLIFHPTQKTIREISKICFGSTDLVFEKLLELSFCIKSYNKEKNLFPSLDNILFVVVVSFK